jgi:hypothetical protein
MQKKFPNIVVRNIHEPVFTGSRFPQYRKNRHVRLGTGVNQRGINRRFTIFDRAT